ncbi:multi-sensor hybrid histidine kinase [Firmicutes bacterium CAG:321]|nr:multi-sensor hybrid histidine kinase [Firmicutes bacterium CAG:321]
MKINTTIFLTIISFFYSVLLMIAYFSKDKIKTLENKVYPKLIIINFIGIILELFCTIFAGYAKDYLVFYTILNKLFLVELTIWCSVFSVYVFLISSKKEKNELKSYLIKVSIFHIVIDVITMFLIFVLPVQFNINDLGYVMYSYGPSVNIVFISSTLYIILMFTCLIRNFKNIKSKKYLPIYVYMVIGVLVGIVQKLHPEILAFTSMEAFITVIMYFTIENPDKKLLEEIHMSKKIADAANEDKSMLIYNMMNEVKSIASDINKSSEVILNSNNLEENRFFAREIISSNNKLYSMANNIYNIDVIDDINVKTVKNKYNIKLLLKEVISKNKELFDDKDISFRFNIDSNLPNTLYGDSINLKNVLNTIIGNSYKYTDKGYVELSVNAIFKKDIVRLIIKIEDSGIGIKAEDLDKCLNKNTKDQNSLYGARKTINIMGGNLLISSEYNKGTIVTIILDQKIYTNNKDNYDNYVNNKKILIIDDNNSGIKLISKILDKHNILYDSSNLGKEALDRIRKGDKYDLILLDEDMPYMNGISVMNKLNKIKGFDTKVILLTKNSNIIYDDIYKDSGFSDYIIKPIDKDDLMNKINKCLK